MTKEDKIKEAYGDYWDVLRKYIDEDGRIHYNDIRFVANGAIKELDMIEPELFLKLIYPKQLEGIRNNNGWTKIESEEDLPVSGEYRVISLQYSKSINAKYARSSNTWLPIGTDDRRFIEVTHYKRIIEDKPPIY
ncbi:hypothetical protein [Chryseobacterium sp.]|uniref:hypothetical protein n=1 Tax=Chryseobacterium sp. TaxID=1871047 RepID=UPI0028A1A623|nr:hypothetical protein [Chryseobacterium sp.]